MDAQSVPPSIVVAFAALGSIACACTFAISWSLEYFDGTFGFGAVTFETIETRAQRWWLPFVSLVLLAGVLNLLMWRSKFGGIISSMGTQDAGAAEVLHRCVSDGGIVFAHVLSLIYLVYMNNAVFQAFVTILTITQVFKPDTHTWLIAIAFQAAKALAGLIAKASWKYMKANIEFNTRLQGSTWDLIIRNTILCACFDVQAPLTLFAAKDMKQWIPDLVHQSGAAVRRDHMDALVHACFAAFVISIACAEAKLTLTFMWKRRLDYGGEMSKLCLCVIFPHVISVINPTVLILGALLLPIMLLCFLLRCWISGRRSTVADHGDHLIFAALSNRLWYSAMFFAVISSQFSTITRLLIASDASSLLDAIPSLSSQVLVVLEVCGCCAVVGLLIGVSSACSARILRTVPNGELPDVQLYFIMVSSICPVTGFWVAKSGASGKRSVCFGALTAVALITSHYVIVVSGSVLGLLLKKADAIQDPSPSATILAISSSIIVTVFGAVTGPLLVLIIVAGLGTFLVASLHCIKRVIRRG